LLRVEAVVQLPIILSVTMQNNGLALAVQVVEQVEEMVFQ
jgi:hypothetical protein